jgi:hypothetical protein
MKTLFILTSLLVLTACARGPVEPTGIYRLGTADKTMELDVRASGDYVLQIDGPDSMTDEIRGRWEEERGGEIDITFHGLVWRGTVPEAGQGLWLAAFERNGGICLDGEGTVCFSKDSEG